MSDAPDLPGMPGAPDGPPSDPFGTTVPAPPPLPPGYTQTASPVPPSLGEFAIKRSVARAVLCSIASFGVYTFYWFYQYRSRISAELGKSDEAALHTAGLLVPFLNLYLIYVFWTDVSTVRQRVGLEEIPAVRYIVLSVIPLVSVVTGPVCYALVAQRLNEYWDVRTGGTATDAPFRGGEKLATFLPMVLIWGTLFLVVGLALVFT